MSPPVLLDAGYVPLRSVGTEDDQWVRSPRAPATLTAMQDDIDRILISQQDIARRVHEMAEQICHDLQKEGDPSGLTLVPLLTGAMIFCADLMRQMPLAMRIGMMTVSSYPGKATQTQGAVVVNNRLGEVRGRDVLLIDDILDSGNTLKLIKPMIEKMQPASLRTCVLLRKDRPSAQLVEVDYVGFDIPDEFVVGYGLDYNDLYRNLPEIVVLKPSVITPAK